MCLPGLEGHHKAIILCKLCFMITGHTHCLVDGCLGIFKQKFGKSECSSLHQQVMNSSASCNEAQLVQGSDLQWREWDNFFSQFFRPIKGIKELHLRFDSTKPGIDLWPSLLSRPEILSRLRTHERMKKAAYGARVNQAERASFTRLVFSTSGVAGKETTIFLKSLATLVVDKNKDLVYSAVMGELYTQVSFCLLRWAITCFRGCRATYIRRKVGSPFAAYCRGWC